MQSFSPRELSFICFGGVDWWYHNRAHIDLQLTTRFAQEGPALYVNSIVMQKLNFGQRGAFLKKLVRKSKSILTGLKKTERGFWVYSPFTLPVHHISWARPVNELILRCQVSYIARRLGIRKPIVVVACPAACLTALKMRKAKLVYQRTDRFEETPGIDVEIVQRYDRKLKMHADLTYFVSQELYQQETDQCRNPFYIDHGVDFNRFVTAEQERFVPADIRNIPKPIIGYFGEINGHSVDLALAERIADMLPQMSFVYVGTLASHCPCLQAKRNVWMLGQKDYDQIPHYGKRFDVAILPWVRNRWTQAANPIKVKEYLALGKPFVSTPVFSEVERYLDVAYVADTAEEFAQKIQRALREDSAERIAARRKKVEKDTWDSKAKLLLETLFNHTQGTADRIDA